jgi:hypothetical protein
MDGSCCRARAEPQRAWQRGTQMGRLRGYHEHFAQHLDDNGFAALARALDKVSNHVRLCARARSG